MVALRRFFYSLPVRPPFGEIFTLTINSRDIWNNPMQMIYAAGHDPKNWKFAGKTIEGVHTCKFKLEVVEKCSNAGEVANVLRKRGNIPEGRWLPIFDLAYKLASIEERLGIADPSWIDERGDSHFPCVTLHKMYFHHADDIRRGGKRWFWLVKVL